MAGPPETNSSNSDGMRLKSVENSYWPHQRECSTSIIQQRRAWSISVRNCAMAFLRAFPSDASALCHRSLVRQRLVWHSLQLQIEVRFRTSGENESKWNTRISSFFISSPMFGLNRLKMMLWRNGSIRRQIPPFLTIQILPHRLCSLPDVLPPPGKRPAHLYQKHGIHVGVEVGKCIITTHGGFFHAIHGL